MEVVERLQEFDPTIDLPEHFFAIYYGLRRSGKTTMLRTMLHEMQEILGQREVHLFSTTAEVSPEDYKYIPKKGKHVQLEMLEQDLGEIIGSQKKKIKQFNEKEGPEPEPLLIILDDCVSENSIRHCPSLNTLAVAGRHMYISVVILSQVVTGSGSVPPIVRTQADAIFVVANPRSKIERKLLIEQYLTPCKVSKEETTGDQILDKATAIQFRALIILTTDSSARDYEEFLILYGPVDDDKIPKDFKLGSPEQWEDEYEEKLPHRKKQKIEKPKKLPNPFDNTPELHMNSRGEFIRGLSDDLFSTGNRYRAPRGRRKR